MSGRKRIGLGLTMLLALACKKEDVGRTDTGPTPVSKEPVSVPASLEKGEPEMNDKIHGEEVTYTAEGLPLKGYLAWDTTKTGRRPGVLVVHEWWGHNEYARRRARMLAELGFTALALDMYGDGKQADHPADAQKFATEVAGNTEGAVKRFEAAKKVLQAQATVDKDKIAAIGYCFGGGVVLNMARTGMDLAGVASFHGSLAAKVPARKGAIKAKIFVANGADDWFAPPEQVAAFKKEMADAGATLELVSYPGAKHSFTNPAADEYGAKFKLPLAYNKAADEQSWAALQVFLRSLWSAPGAGK